MALLLDNATSAQSTSWQRWRGGKGSFSGYGNYDTATLKLQARMSESGETIDIASFTASNHTTFELPVCEVRADLSSVGNNTKLSANLTELK